MRLAQDDVLGEFHDGFLNGFVINQENVSVFLSTEGAERYVAMAYGVVAMVADGFKAGNVIFEVLIKAGDLITLADVAETYGLPLEGLAPKGNGVAAQAERLLEESRQRNLQVLEINPSYGGRCLILAGSIDILPHAKWEASRE